MLQTALVTGASGFIGTALCRELASREIQIHAVSRTPPARAELGNQIWWRADLTELNAVRQIFSSVRPDVTFHLASLVTGARGLEYVLPTVQNNFLSALHVLMAAAESGSGCVVLANSFEEPDWDNPVPCSPYAAAKSCSTTYARMFHALYDVPVIVAQIYMVYGPGQTDCAKLVPYVTRSLLEKSSVKLSSGRRPVDWIYVQDVVEGLVSCAVTPGIEGAVVELGTGELHSVRTVVEMIARIVDSTGMLEFGALPDRPSERVRRANVLASEKLIAWRPRFRLEDGLARTVDWYRHQDHFELVTTASR